MLVIDDFMSEVECELVYQETIKQEYTLHRSLPDREWNMLSANHDRRDNNCRNVFNSITLLSEVIGNKLIRSYTNLAPPGTFFGGDLHEDDGKITALYYPQEWDTMWGGGTYFEDGSTLEYVKNRLVLFDAQTKHKALPHVSPNGWRITVAYKTGLEWKQNEDRDSK